MAQAIVAQAAWLTGPSYLLGILAPGHQSAAALMGQNPVAIAAAIVTTLLSFIAKVAAMSVVCREAKEVAKQCDIAAWGAWVRAVEFMILTVGLFIAPTVASIAIEETGASSPAKLAVDGASVVVDCAVATLAFWIRYYLDAASGRHCLAINVAPEGLPDGMEFGFVYAPWAILATLVLTALCIPNVACQSKSGEDAAFAMACVGGFGAVVVVLITLTMAGMGIAVWFHAATSSPADAVQAVLTVSGCSVASDLLSLGIFACLIVPTLG